MRHITLLVTFICCLWSTGISGNDWPIDPNYEIGITEVYILDIFSWDIELNGNWLLYDEISGEPPAQDTFPCTTEVCLLITTDSTQGDLYKADVVFAENRRGVISRESLKNVSSTKRVSIVEGCTLKVALDEEDVTSTDRSRYWVFPVGAWEMGHSLVAINYYNEMKIYSTSRISIGSPGNYATKYKITMRNSYGRPLQGIRPRAVDVSFIETDTTEVSWLPLIETDSLGVCYVPISIPYSDTVIRFRDVHSIHSAMEMETLLPEIPVHYSDTDTLIARTVRMPVTPYRLTVKDPDTSRSLFCVVMLQSSSHANIAFQSKRSSTLICRIYPTIPVVGTLCLKSTKNPDSEECLGTWSGTYIDTPAVITDTITIASTSARGAIANEMAGGSDVTIVPRYGSGNKVGIVVSAPRHFSPGAVSLYAVNGTVIETRRIEMNRSSSGTTLFLFPKGTLSPGIYLCTFSTGACPTVSHRIVIP